MRRLLAFVVSVALTGAVAVAAGPLPGTPGLTDRCPVCGMLVAPFFEFQAQIAFSDGSYAFFDGNHDMFQYYLKLAKEDPEKAKRIGGVFVTDYYSVETMEATAAYYVVGSNVYGPMGAELIAFRSEEAAKEFEKDHKGKSILRFDEVTEETLRNLK